MTRQERQNEYMALVKQVRTFNPDAAAYMVGRGLVELSSPVVCGSIAGCFLWGETPQGFDFWSHMKDLLDGLVDVTDPEEVLP